MNNGNIFFPYKNREIDFTQPVFIYRNLTRTKKNADFPIYSIKQNNKVVAHATHLTLKDVEFIVNEKGRQWVIKNNKKVVHAYIKAIITFDAVKGTNATYKENTMKYGHLGVVIFYNPFRYDSFRRFYQDFSKDVKTAGAVLINKWGVTAAYVN